jgi:hypothetical protein
LQVVEVKIAQIWEMAASVNLLAASEATQKAKNARACAHPSVDRPLSFFSL